MQLSSHNIATIKNAFDALGGGIDVVDIELEPSPNMLSELAEWTMEPLMYVSTPSQSTQYVGLGKWDTLTNNDAAQFLMQPGSDKIYLFGGNSFNEAIESKQLASELWIVPVAMIIQTEDQCSLRVVLDKRQEDNNWDNILMGLNAINTPATKESNAPPAYVTYKHFPTKDAWTMNVKDIKDKIAANELKKVVLARETSVQFSDELNPFLMVKHIQDNDPQLYHFVCRFSQDLTFIGGTPERLFQINDNQLESDAIAGTIKKEAYTPAFIRQKKEHDEHQFVADFILNVFKSMCKEMSVSPPDILELKHLCHLIQGFKGTLKDDVKPMDVLNALHPTPAVAGTPTDQALNIIQKHEPFSREWYAGPVGVLSNNESLVVVAIRSGIVKQRNVTLYAGAGIIDASDPDSEWEELNAKIGGFTDVFGPK